MKLAASVVLGSSKLASAGMEVVVEEEEEAEEEEEEEVVVMLKSKRWETVDPMVFLLDELQS